MSSIASDQLREAWRSAGLGWGDTVLIHSNSRRMVRRLMKSGAALPVAMIIASLRDTVGPEGTVIFPTFNFDFAKSEPFDVRHTPSEMGLLTEEARDGVPARSGHPIYSFVAYGARADEINTACNSSGYGTDSPFGLLHRWGGKIAILDLPDQDAMTFYHYVEECHQVDYRYHKRFTGAYTGWDGVTSERTFGLFVRGDGVVTDVRGMEAYLWFHGAYKGEKPGEGWGIRTISAPTLFDLTSAVIRSGKAVDMLYRPA